MISIVTQPADKTCTPNRTVRGVGISSLPPAQHSHHSHTWKRCIELYPLDAIGVGRMTLDFLAEPNAGIGMGNAVGKGVKENSVVAIGAEQCIRNIQSETRGDIVPDQASGDLERAD